MAAASGPDTDRIRGLFMREWRPAASPKGVFLLLHGMESHSGWFAELGGRLVARGWAVAAFDRSGWGKSPGVRGELASYRDFVEETCGLASELRQRYGALHLAGMSWGGMGALYLGLRRGWLFDSIALLAPGLAAKKDLDTRTKLRVAWSAFRKNLSLRVEPVFRPDDFTRDPRWRQYIAEDPVRVHQVTASFCLETLKMRRFIGETAGRRLLPPTLCLLAGDDAIIDNPRVAEICRRAEATVETIPESSHTLIFDQPTLTADLLLRHAAEAGENAGRSRGRVWVVGGGAVGGALGSLLSFRGVTTGILVKESHLRRLPPDGYTLRTGHARRSTGKAVTVAADPALLPGNPDLVVLAVKSFDTPGVLSQLAGKIPPGAVLASLQNGVGNEDAVAQAFPHHTVIAASICASLELDGPARILWADDRGGMGAALHRGDAEQAREVWSRLARRTGMECLWVDGPNASPRLKWSKLMLNIGFNALNSVTGMTSADLLQDPEYSLLAIQALREGFAVMRRQSLDPVDLPGFPVAKLSLAIRMPLKLIRRLMAWQAKRAEEAAFSMRQDMLQKRQNTEIQELNGKIVHFGRQLGLNVEANEKLVEMVKEFMKST